MNRRSFKLYLAFGVAALFTLLGVTYSAAQRTKERQLIELCGHLLTPDIHQQDSALNVLKKMRPAIDAEINTLLLAELTFSRIVWQSLPNRITANFPFRAPHSAAYKRKVAIAAIGMLGPPLSPETQAALIQTCSGPDSFVRNRAALILGYLGTNSSETLSAIGLVFRTEEHQKLRSFGANHYGFNLTPNSIEASVRALTAPLPAARYQAADNLSTYGTNSAVAVSGLIRCLHDTNDLVVSASIRALGRIGPAARKATPHLVKLTSRQDNAIRNNATRALQEIQQSPDDARESLSGSSLLKI